MKLDNSIIKIGTSGWSYAHWDKVFYPEELEQKAHLAFYASFFNTVEINTTFYHLPLENVVKNWRLQVPKNFIFSVKASRFITHNKRLIDCEEAIDRFYERIFLLQEKLGPILFQLPPSFAKNAQRLQDFLSLLTKKQQHAIEFRHPSWFDDETYRILRKYQIALCISDLNGNCSPLITTSNFVYIRLHGPKKAYTGRYSPAALTAWKQRLLTWKEEGKEVYIYFDNDDKSYAVKDGLKLRERMNNEKANY